MLAVGQNSVDLLLVLDGYPRPDGKQAIRALRREAGGQMATAAAAVAALGVRAEYIGRFGDDEAGRLGRASLAAAGVEQGRAVVVPGATSRLAVILIDATAGTRTVLWHEDPRLGPVRAADVPDAALEDARLVLLDDFGEEAAAVAPRARRAGARTLLDVEVVRPGIEALLRHIDVIIAAGAFPAALTGRAATGEALAALRDLSGAAVVVATLGSDGSLAWDGTRLIHTPAFRVPVADTTGAGDVFRAGFAAAWLDPTLAGDLGAVLRYASAAAALACRGVGARGSLPSRAEVATLWRAEAAEI